ncbi:MAG TPA: pantoate--beta-alanine ligase [Acidobacteriaceae bacterium]|jgi:pantoate--beta-alanine ligase|nr:pantoate--beta-alanine ligase [Acidobacteriaceae bacterium]
MQIARTIPEMRAAVRALRPPQHTVGFVPTMGALHAGHRSLMQAARERCDVVVASIFVNPTQFGPKEDFSRYPRTFDADCHMLEEERVDILYAPTTEEMYPAGGSTVIRVEGISDRLDGVSRPGHFYGVATVVAKLLHIVQPDVVFFGQKDAAQVAVLRRMVRDLDMPVELAICPIVRERDGLAMSSRNRYLSPEERRQALSLSRALYAAETLAKSGEQNATRLLEAMERIFATEPTVKIDYLAVVDADTLLPVEDTRNGALVAIAAKVGSTRLIDNVLLPPAS